MEEPRRAKEPAARVPPSTSVLCDWADFSVDREPTLDVDCAVPSDIPYTPLVRKTLAKANY